MDINEYRTVRNQIQKLNDELKELEKKRSEFEASVFLELDTGDVKDYDEFRFEVKTGKRSLTPKSDFQDSWDSFVRNCPEDDPGRAKLGMMVKSQVIHKGPTLTDLEKTLDKSPYLRENYEHAKTILGYSEGTPRQTVTVVEKTPTDVRPGHYCHSKVAGTTHRKDVDWTRIRNGDTLRLEREPNNPHDRNAIRIYDDAQFIGYVRGELAQTIAPHMDNGTRFSGRVKQVTGGGELNHGCNIELIVEE